MRDVTKTKPSHYRPTNKAPVVAAPQVPVTPEGTRLAADVRASGHSPEAQARYIREIIEYEATHGTCTQTFLRKIRKQLRPG